jgi:hypothetical protein
MRSESKNLASNWCLTFTSFFWTLTWVEAILTILPSYQLHHLATNQ